MGKKDVKWSDYLKDNRRYADIINGVMCEGRQIVSQEDLTELDSKTKQKFRDEVRKVALGVNFAVIGIENQDEVDYELPLRVMEYDVASYRRQISAIKRKIREEQKDQKTDAKLKAGEYMYGFKKTSQLHPVMTVVLYAGVEPWDGPESLGEIIDFTGMPDSMKKLVQDYKIKVVDIRRLKDTSMFKTDIRHVFDFIRYAEQKTELMELIGNEPYYQSMDEEACELVTKYANIKEGTINMAEYKGKDGKVNMCKGLLDWAEENKAEGREEGREEGRILGAEETNRKTIKNMLKKNKSIEEICEIVECDETYVQKVMNEQVVEL